MQFEGIYDDGWLTQASCVMLPGGGPADLVFRAEVLPCADQHLEIRINGSVVASHAVEPGALALRFPVAASESERRVELHWTETAALNDDDDREAAALLQFLDLTTDTLPAALRIPGGLAHPGAEHVGIFADGWCEQHAQVFLAGGERAILVVRGAIPEALAGQRLELELNGTQLFGGALPPGSFDVRLPLDASDTPRRIELHWGSVVNVSDSDARHAAALLSFVGVAPGTAPASLQRFPIDLSNPSLTYSGIDVDGWVEKRVEVSLAGGPAAEFVLRAELPTGLDEQEVEVVIDGVGVGSGAAVDGKIEIRVSLPSAAADRDVALAWARTTTLSPQDAREVAARLSYLGIVSGRVPDAIARFPSDLADPNLISSGLQTDGWSALESFVILAGGPAADLVVTAGLPKGLREQDLSVEIDGVPLASVRASNGRVDVRAPLPSSDAPRRIGLRFGTVGPISKDDRRPAAALIDMIAIVPRSGR